MTVVQNAKSDKWIYAIVALCLLHPCFYLLFNSNLLFLPLFFAALGSIFSFLNRKDFRLDGVGFLWMWILCGLFIFLSCLINHGRLLIVSASFFVGTVLLYINSDRTNWITPCLQTFSLLMLIYGITTILFYIFPGAYQPFKALFFSDVAEAVDYRSGLTSHYSFNGTYIAIGLVTSVSLCLFCKSDRRSGAWYLASVLMAVALLLTTKRAHLLSAIAAIVLTYCLTRKSGKFTKLLFALGFVAVFLQLGSSFIPGISESISRLLDTVENASSDGNLLTRGVLWGHAWSVFLDHPLLGQGWGTFIYHWANGETTLIAHNELMNTLAEDGALGAVLINCLVLFSMISTLRLLKQNEDPSLQGYLLSSFCLQVYSVIYGYSTGTLFSYEINFVPYLLSIAILCACKYSFNSMRREK